MVLNPKRDLVEEVLPFLEDSCAIVVPEVSEVNLNPVSEGNRDVQSTGIWLILDLLDHDEPVLQLVLIVVEIARAHREHDVDEVVHQDGEESHAKDLDHTAHDLL